ncbi:hypothetical protein EMGBD2_14120 [Nitrospirota bacterium]|nr:hypothetical protein EMGBD2_14120 [Nitrospirota bacterium]
MAYLRISFFHVKRPVFGLAIGGLFELLGQLINLYLNDAKITGDYHYAK